MGRKLGTVAGWERDPEWSSDNRVYIGPGYDNVRETKKLKKYIYEVEFNIEFYFGDSDCVHPEETIVTRIIKDPPIKVIRVRNIKYPGGLDAFVDDFVESEAEKVMGDSIVELAGMASCDPSYEIDIINKHFKVIYHYDETKLPEIPSDFRGKAVSYSPKLGRYINKTTWKTIRMCARPEWEIYGIPRAECDRRMKSHGFSSEETDILISEFNNNELIDI